MFIQDADILTAVANMLRQRGGSAALAPFWSQIVIGVGSFAGKGSHNSAYQDIVDALTQRGFSIAQINQWDRGAEFELQQSLFWTYTLAGDSAQMDALQIRSLDKRAELKSMTQLSIAGVWQQPNAAPNQLPGGCMTGPSQTAINLSWQNGPGGGPYGGCCGPDYGGGPYGIGW